MRAFFSVSPRFHVSLPWWLAAFAYLIWLTAALSYWILLGGWVALVLGVQLAVRLWREYGPERT